MAVRRFRPSARVALFLAARGHCAACGEPLRPGWHARPRRAGERGRRDRAGERAGAVPALQPGQGRAAGVIAPRGLAGRVPRSARGARAGATSCSWRRPARARRSPPARRCAPPAEQIVVVCPTTALRAQWADAADRVGLHLDPRWRNADGAWRSDLDGVVVTYQQVASAPDLFAHHLARPTFVVLDEVHHAGESATWGTALRAAFDGATHRLALSGHAVSLRRPGDPVRALRRRAPLRARLRLRLRRGSARRRLPPARVPAARRDAALARRCAGDDRGVRRRARPDRRRAPAAHRDRPEHAAAAADAARRRRAADQGARGHPRRRRARPLRRPRSRARHRGAAAHDRRREAGRRGQRRAAGARPDRAFRARRRRAPRAGSSRSTWSARASTSRA